MSFLTAAFRWLGLKGSILLAVVALLGGLLVIEKMGHADTRADLTTMTAKYDKEVLAHKLTVANYRVAAEKARREDAENLIRVQREREEATQRIESDYQARLADARARADRLRQQLNSRTNPGNSGTAPMPGVPDATGGANGPTQGNGFSVTERLIATEQAIQLDGLQQWIRSMKDLPVSPSSNATESR